MVKTASRTPHESDTLNKAGVFTQHDDDNDNNNDSAYGVVIMTEVIARVHQVHLMNVD